MIKLFKYDTSLFKGVSIAISDGFKPYKNILRIGYHGKGYVNNIALPDEICCLHDIIKHPENTITDIRIVGVDDIE
jgi:hypothetical protein